MKLEKIINFLNEEYPIESAYLEDYIGMQLKGKDEITTVYVTLDITLKVIEEAINKKVDLIIAHHPLFYGEKEELIKKDLILKSKVDLLKKLNINVYIIHTNADFNPISISYSQALALELENINQIDLNQAVKANLRKEKTLIDFIKYIKNTFDIKNKIRTNIPNNLLPTKKLIIASGAMGDLIYDYKYRDSIFVIGELKYHHWIYANDNNVKVIEIGHQTEDIFVSMIKNYFKSNDYFKELIIIKNKEDHVYRTI
ncbi:MAG: hypothetical protein HPAVJP_2830 [Candidatus Hepatoplasma vulgare]|nr:MAG: hypothetical protein HPAVJP_2830 [Candidatus Hepatoplasma sp.]